MSQSIALLSSVELDTEQLADFVLNLGGFVDSGPQFHGRISEENRHIWIFFSPEEIPHYLEDADEKADILAGLGELPKTHIPIEISRAEGSKKIALNFAVEFGKKWPVVMSNLSEKIISHDELKAMQANADISLR